ncbi:GNAT family N-acetyltransferase [[Clostridium] polysaccharolyticum]|uniref:Lysophospholipase L1 n=1 Tax=[Clostridium] polysaccharolyticum TaxID=29364 RepID=A0A1I0DF82_9FIRM|nr:GNAT family N-acetyltransferase [[Clostridium] polysaccharolyticum]SET31056.1 Lysophospholipase L1 [[Clostridium] polysaccharolyticum]
MKTVVCYGDSNTYGYNPVNGLRYPKEIRWTGRLQELLGENYNVIEEGCNGRTTMFEDATDPWKAGLPYIKPCLNTHKPVDIVIMMLGSNDLKKQYGAAIERIAEGAENCVKEILDFAKTKQVIRPEIILVAPPIIGDGIVTSDFSCNFDETAIVRSRQFKLFYKEIAERYDCAFISAADYVKSSEVDSLHLMPEEHEKFAKGLAQFIKEIISKKIKVTTKRLIMRPYNQVEMEVLREKETDAELKKAYGEMLACMKALPDKEYWGAAWKIALENGTIIGDLCFKGEPDKSGAVEIGYGIDAKYQRNGYGTEMVAAMAHWALVQPGVKLVVAQTNKENLASQKVLRNNGFIQDGYGEEGPRFVRDVM